VSLVPVLIAASFLSFSIMYLCPGDPARIILEMELQAPPTQRQLVKFKAQHGLDQPFVLQYANWLGRALHGDLGTSLKTGKKVTPVLIEKLGHTAAVFFPGMILSLAIALPLGIMAAVKADSVLDHGLRFTTLGCISIPGFWWGILLIYCTAIRLRWLPAFGYGRPECYILPIVTLGITGSGELMRLTRASVLEVLQLNFVRTARSKGLGQTTILIRHVLRNAFVPIVTSIGLYCSHLVGGSIIIETLFAWPGIGRHLATAAAMRDVPVIQGIVFISGLFFVLLNLAIDLAYTFLDPRIKMAENKG